MIHKWNVINARIDIIDAKTDILYLSVVSNQVSSLMGETSSKLMEIHGMMKTKEYEELKAGDPKKEATMKKFNMLRAQNEDLSLTFDSVNLALNKLIRALHEPMQKKHPSLSGDIQNTKLKPKKGVEDAKEKE